MNKTKFARRLRTDSTDAEHLLWAQLRAHRFYGLKFKRQQPIGPYIVDFVCFEKRLVIELDGGQHADHQKYDEQRDIWLEIQGFQVLRFWNNDVMSNLDGLLVRLSENCTPSPPPLPHQGGRE